MSATDELRKMLGERGVVWEAPSDSETWWETEGNNHWSAEENGDGKYLTFEAITCVTPEQAVEATLGAGTCKNVHEPPKDTTFWPSPHFKCSECGATHVSMEYVFYCPNCGRKVVDE